MDQARKNKKPLKSVGHRGKQEAEYVQAELRRFREPKGKGDLHMPPKLYINPPDGHVQSNAKLHDGRIKIDNEGSENSLVNSHWGH